MNLLDHLKRHPFPVRAHFEHSIVLTYAVEPSLVQSWLPPCLELDMLDERTAFLAAAFVSTRKLRPVGFPAWLGQDFVLCGYRLFVRHTNAAGRRLRGLYILRSETNRRFMQCLGNLFTHYSYRRIAVRMERRERRFSITTQDRALDVEVEEPVDQAQAALPPEGPFRDWPAARQFSGPMPFTFSFDSQRRQTIIIEGERETWKPLPLRIHHARIPFLRERGLDSARLASAFIVKDVAYGWKRGIVEPWPHGADIARTS